MLQQVARTTKHASLAHAVCARANVEEASPDGTALVDCVQSQLRRRLSTSAHSGRAGKTLRGYTVCRVAEEMFGGPLVYARSFARRHTKLKTATMRHRCTEIFKYVVSTVCTTVITTVFAGSPL